MRKFTKLLVVIALILGMSAVNALAGVGTVTVKLLASDGTTGVAGATVKYYKGGQVTLGVTDANGDFSQVISDISGTTTFYLLPANGGTRIWLAVDPATNPTLTAQMVAVTIDLKTCSGTPLVGEALYNRSGWKSLGNTPVTVDLLPYTGLGPGQGSYDFRMRYDGRTSETLRQDISVDASVDFTTTRVDFAFAGPIQYYNGGWQTFVGPKEMIGGTETMNPANIGRAEFRFGSPVVYQKYFNITGCNVGGALIRLVDENNAPLANLNLGNLLTYKSRCGGSWTYNGVPFQTDANGFALLNTYCAGNNWDGQITVNLNKTSLEQVVATNSIYQAAWVNVNLKTCAGAPIAGANVEQGSGSWTPRGTTDVNGQNGYHAFPGNNVVAKVGYNYGSQTLNATVALPVTNINFVTTKVTLNGAAPIAIQVGGWPTITSPIELLPGTYGFRFNGKLISGVVVSGCEFSRTLLQVKNESNGPVAGATFVPACGGSWQPQTAGSTDANGCLFAEVPVCMTKIKANVGSSSQELTKAQLDASGYIYTTQVLRINFINASGAAITDGLGTIQSGGGWPTIGSFNVSGYFDVNSFPATTGFRASYNNTTEQKNFTIGAAAGIQQETFQTGQVIGTCITQYAGAGWSTFVSGMQQMPGTRNFRYPLQSGTVTAGAITYLTGCPVPEIEMETEPKSAIIGDGVTPEFSYKLYPVPANRLLNVHITLVANEHVEYQVYDLTGRTMKNGTWKLNKGLNTNEIAVDDLVDGQYIFKLKSTEKVITEKFSVSKY